MKKDAIVDSDSEYNVSEINPETEEERYGSMGSTTPLLAGLAESLLDDCEKPDLVVRCIEQNKEGIWKIDPNMISETFYPGNSSQACIIVITHFKDNEKNVDYYQVPYSEIVPRTKIQLKTRMENPRRLIISQVRNVQLETWLEETGVMCLSRRNQKLLDKEADEIIRNEYDDGVESREEPADDSAARTNGE